MENMLGFGGAVALSEDWNATLVRHGMEKGMDRRVLSCVVCDLVMGCWCCMDLLLLVLLLTRSCGVWSSTYVLQDFSCDDILCFIDLGLTSFTYYRIYWTRSKEKVWEIIHISININETS